MQEKESGIHEIDLQCDCQNWIGVYMDVREFFGRLAGVLGIGKYCARRRSERIEQHVVEEKNEIQNLKSEIQNMKFEIQNMKSEFEKMNALFERMDVKLSDAIKLNLKD